MAFADSNNTICEHTEKLTDITELKLSLIENKRSGIMRLNIREFKHTPEYDGPTKNGMMFKINVLEDIQNFQKYFNDFFEEAKKHI